MSGFRVIVETLKIHSREIQQSLPEEYVYPAALADSEVALESALRGKGLGAQSHFSQLKERQGKGSQAF